MSSRELAAGTLVAGKYQLIERLGGGGMGDVYRAENQLAGRIVALKILRPDYAEDANLTERFFQEAKAANKIGHPNIVDIFDAGFSDQGPYVMMECLEGLSLSAALGRLEKFSEATALAIVLPMLDALDAAHRAGIVHRDLKPENVYLAWVDREGGSGRAAEVRVKLLDFGIAKVLDVEEGASPRTRTGVVFGTPDYLSPEQASGEALIDGRSDLFSVGILLFELITGRRPFEAANAVATAYKIVHSKPPTLRAMGVKTSTEMQTVLDVALAKRREDRFSSATAFADMLAPLVPDGITRRRLLRTSLEEAIATPDSAPRESRALAPATRPSGKQPPPESRPAEADAAVSPLGPTERPPAPPRAAAPPAERSEPRPLPRPPASDPRVASAPRSGTLSSGTPASRGSSPDLGRASISAPRPPIETPKRSTSPRDGGRTWAPRPLPAMVRGKCKVRGSLPRAVNHWIERAFGTEARNRVLHLVPTEHADLFRSEGFNALVWYELEALDTFVEAVSLELLRGEVAQWRLLARDHFERDLAAVFRSPRTPDGATLLKRTPALWAKIFDFGTFRLQEGAWGRMSVKVDGYDGASLALRYATIGTVEGMLRHAGFNGASVRILAGEASFAREFEYEVMWVPKG